MSALPENLYAAHNWITAAGEWDDALASPETYAKEAAANAIAHDVTDVTETNLLSVITWRRIGDVIRTKTSAATKNIIGRIVKGSIDDEPENMCDVRELFEMLYGRPPDTFDGEPNEWWGLCCDAILPPTLREASKDVTKLADEMKVNND